MECIREKDIIKKILAKYKAARVLWDTSHEFYNKKVYRNEALGPLLKLYKLIEPKANLSDLRRKLENMRATYRRERVKTMKLHQEGNVVYVPRLWYYNYYTFIDEDDDATTKEQDKTQVKEEEDSDEYEIEKIEDDCDTDGEEDTAENTVEAEDNTKDNVEDEENSNSQYVISTTPENRTDSENILYISERSASDEDTDENPEEVQIQPTPKKPKKLTESEAFGKTVALQLCELNPVQRFLAEKLISEIIFFGRIEKLDSSIVIVKKSK